MTAEALTAYIAETYGAEPEHPWARYPDHAVFRHDNNRKWFALIMTIPREKLGLAGSGMISVVNLKCGPILLGSLLGAEGFFPAWHMSKTEWVSAALDGTADDDRLRFLLEVSYDATALKVKNPNAKKK